MSTKILGNQGELLARRYLENLGYIFLHSNFRSKTGEIDLIFKDSGVIVFVEVKTRKVLTQGLPEEAVTRSKLRKLEKTAEFFLLTNKCSESLARIDVVAIEFITNPPTIRHLKNVTG